LNLALLDNKIQSFIDSNIDKSITALALQKNPFPDIEWSSILNQILAKSKAKEKLPTWFKTPNIIYPSKVSIEQTSSEKTASYKASIVAGEHLIDLSGGFGIDDYFFSKKIKKVVHCEINSELSKIAAHNFQQLKTNNITCIAGDSHQTLLNHDINWDWIYIDPSRRNETKGKVFMLKDCLPNVPENLNLYFEKTQSILIKTAPILDITAANKELKNIKSIHIVALDNEVKELLWELQKEYDADLIIKTINITKNNSEIFEFVFNQNIEENSYSLPKKYLFEPNSAIMKSGGFAQIGLRYNLEKLHKHSHLYTSNDLIPFPGRIFKIEKNILYNKTQMKLELENQKCNITTRNFPESVENIRKKWKIKEGGNKYCFFTTDANNNKIVLICTKI